MRLEPMHAQPTTTIDAGRTRRSLIGLVAGGAIAITTGCASGSRREAERGRARDAERTSVMDTMQQTATASLVNGTPPSTPQAEDE